MVNILSSHLIYIRISQCQIGFCLCVVSCLIASKDPGHYPHGRCVLRLSDWLHLHCCSHVRSCLMTCTIASWIIWRLPIKHGDILDWVFVIEWVAAHFPSWHIDIDQGISASSHLLFAPSLLPPNGLMGTGTKLMGLCIQKLLRLHELDCTILPVICWRIKFWEKYILKCILIFKLFLLQVHWIWNWWRASCKESWA